MPLVFARISSNTAVDGAGRGRRKDGIQIPRPIPVMPKSWRNRRREGGWPFGVRPLVIRVPEPPRVVPTYGDSSRPSPVAMPFLAVPLASAPFEHMPSLVGSGPPDHLAAFSRNSQEEQSRQRTLWPSSTRSLTQDRPPQNLRPASLLVQNGRWHHPIALPVARFLPAEILKLHCWDRFSTLPQAPSWRLQHLQEFSSEITGRAGSGCHGAEGPFRESFGTE